MGLVSLYLGLAAASAAAQVPHHEQAQQPAAIQLETPPRVQAEPLAFQLPATPAVAAPQRIALQKEIAWPKATEPLVPADPFQLPSADWYRGNSPAKLNLVGVKFGWDL